MNPMLPRSAFVLGAGEDVPKHPPPIHREDVVICANGGARLARRWGLRPALIMGDHDSLQSEDRAYWQDLGVEFMTFPAEKDQTDLDLAVEQALEYKPEQIVLVGAWGGRIDHSLGNLELLHRLANQGVANWLLTRAHRLSVFRGTFVDEVAINSTVSLLPLSPTASGIQSEGLLYPLRNTTIKQGLTLTISNQATAKRIYLSCKTGVLLIILET